MCWRHSSPDRFWGPRSVGPRFKPPLAQPCRTPKLFCCSWLSMAPGLSPRDAAELPARSPSRPAWQQGERTDPARTAPGQQG